MMLYSSMSNHTSVSNNLLKIIMIFIQYDNIIKMVSWRWCLVSVSSVIFIYLCFMLTGILLQKIWKKEEQRYYFIDHILFFILILYIQMINKYNSNCIFIIILQWSVALVLLHIKVCMCLYTNIHKTCSLPLKLVLFNFGLICDKAHFVTLSVPL